MLSAGEWSSMSGKERVIAAVLLAVAVAGGASIPRLLSSPPGALSVALGPGPSRSVVQAPAIPNAPHRKVPARVTPPAQPVATVPAPVVRPAPKPRPVPAKHVSPPPPPTAALTPPPPPTPTTTTTTTTAPPPPVAPLSLRPGHGYGDKNHTHTGPRSLAGLSPAAKPGRRSHGGDLEGSGHGRSLSQTPSDAVGPRHRGVGHLAATPPAAAPAAHEAGPPARPQAGGPGGQGSSPPPVAPDPGNQDQGQGKGQGQGQGQGQGKGHG
jgi:hypothetical protein